MWHVGVDLHRKTVVIAAVHDSGEVRPPVRLQNSEVERIKETFRAFAPFRAVVEATGTYRWFHKLVAPMGTILLAHPGKLRIMVQRRSKTDTLDSQLLANLLRINQIPLAYIPSGRVPAAARHHALPRTLGTRCRCCEELSAGTSGSLQHAADLQVPIRTTRLVLVLQAAVRLGRQHGPR